MDVHEELNLIRLDPNYRLIFGQGGQIDATTDIENMASQIEELSGPQDAEGFRKYMDDNRRKLDSRRNVSILLGRGLRSNQSQSSPCLKSTASLRSVSSDLSKLFKDDRLKWRHHSKLSILE